MGQELTVLAIFGAIAVGLDVAAFYLLRAWPAGNRPRHEGVQSTARCTFLQVFDGGVSLHFEYQVRGVAYCGESSILSITGTAPGQDMAIVYDPARPSHPDAEACVAVNSTNLLAFLALAAVGIGLSCFTAVYLGVVVQ
ncbi:hypothetical protein [Streptomyces sp. NPDC052225]|uniref:hypothetical protein n=1 Tax=Streptomyces sp. NPDC052225 TaxID=3154949 RepID=UPI003425AFE8